MNNWQAKVELIGTKTQNNEFAIVLALKTFFLGLGLWNYDERWWQGDGRKMDDDGRMLEELCK